MVAIALAETARLIASLELKDQFSAPARRVEGSLGSLDRRFDATSSRAYRAGTQIGAGIRNAAKLAAAASAIIGTAAVGVFVKSLQAASDLGETVSKVGVVFKAQAAQVLAFGKTSASALGLSENAALAAAATYGNLFVSMGLASKKSAEMSIALVKLAGDLASFNNIDPTEALEKLRAGLTGESEPLKTLGININEQTLKAKALELGLVKLTKGQKTYTAVLDPATKAQAAYALIFEQSKTAQGDFARTSGGLANQIRILKANFGNLMTTLATPTLPKVALIFQRINAEVLKNQPAIAKLGDSIAGLFTDKNIDAGFNAIKNVFETVKAAAPVLQQTAQATLGIVKAAVGLFQSLPPEVQKLAVGAFAINKLTGGLVTNIAGGIVGAILGRLKSAVVNVQGAVVNVGGAGALPAAVGGGASTLGKIANVATKVFLVGAAAGVLTELAGLLGDVQKGNREQSEFIAKSVANEIQVGSAADLIKARQALLEGINAITGGGRNRAELQAPSQELINLRKQLELVNAELKRRGAAGLLPQIGAIISTAFTSALGSVHLGKQKDDLVDLKQLSKATNAYLSDGFNRMVTALKTAKTAEQIRSAIKTAVSTVVTNAKGSVQATVRTLNALKAQLKNVHDPKLKADLNAAIRKVEAKLPGRQFAAAQLDRLRAILADGKITNRELKEVQSIERALKDRGLPHAAQTIAEKVQAAQRAISEASRAAGQQAAFAIRDKDLSVNVSNQVRVSTTVSVSSLGRAQTTYRLYGSRYQF